MSGDLARWLTSIDVDRELTAIFFIVKLPHITINVVM